MGLLALMPSLLMANEEAKKPNVLFILTDDQRADTIHALGNDTIITPNIDSLVKRGFAFNNTYCFGSNSGAVCLPSRNMLLSGRAYFRFNGRYASADKPNLPDSMNKAGLETYHHGKGGNTARLIHKRFDHSKYVTHHNKLKNGQPCKVIVDAAIDFLKSRSTEKPFFLYLAPSEPHDLRIPAKEYLDMYRREEVPLPKNYLPMHPFNSGDLTIRDEKLETWPRKKEAVRQHLHEYYAFITGLDHHFGRLFKTLKKMDQFDNTIIIFASDNGLAVGSHGLMGKQSIYEHSTKVPLIIAGPGIPKGESDALTYLMDVFPTLCELLKAPIPTGLDGQSLAPIIHGKASRVRKTLFSAYKNHQRSVRDDRWKLIRYPLINKTLLFDLKKDPHETQNLAENPEYASHIERMMGQIRVWQKGLGDKQPLTSNKPGPAEVTIDFFNSTRSQKKK